MKNALYDWYDGVCKVCINWFSSQWNPFNRVTNGPKIWPHYRCHGNDVATLISDIFLFCNPAFNPRFEPQLLGGLYVIHYRVCSHCKMQTMHRLKTTGPEYKENADCVLEVDSSLRLRANGRNNSQHCCANNVGSCCVCVGNGVQTDATTPYNVRTCSASWEGYSQEVFVNHA